jgi:hypothetical protein
VTGRIRQFRADRTFLSTPHGAHGPINGGPLSHIDIHIVRVNQSEENFALQKHTLGTDLEPCDQGSRTGGPSTTRAVNLEAVRPFDPCISARPRATYSMQTSQALPGQGGSFLGQTSCFGHGTLEPVPGARDGTHVSVSGQSGVSFKPFC